MKNPEKIISGFFIFIIFNNKYNCHMVLTKQQTLELFANQAKNDAFIKKYKFSTKSKWYCLSCGKVLFISYKQSSIYSVFCEPCYGLFHRKPTIVQVQYMMKLKNLQLEFVEKYIEIENPYDKTKQIVKNKVDFLQNKINIGNTIEENLNNTE